MQSILITGASSGFGLETAVALAARGWRVFATMRDPDKSGELTRRARAADLSAAERISVLRLDVTDQASIDSAVADVLSETGGKLDALLNNAGYTTSGFFEDLTDDDCRRVMETDFFGALAVSRAVIPTMREAGRGRIAVVSSNALNVPHPMFSIYAAAKWALEGWAEALAMELAPFGIDVTILQPGNHDTRFGANVVPVIPDASAYHSIIEAVVPQLNKLGQRARNVEKATGNFVEALSAPRPRFRYRIGFDDRLFALLKGVTPYRFRACLLRRIIRFPGSVAK